MSETFCNVSLPLYTIIYVNRYPIIVYYNERDTWRKVYEMQATMGRLLSADKTMACHYFVRRINNSKVSVLTSGHALDFAVYRLRFRSHWFILGTRHRHTLRPYYRECLVRLVCDMVHIKIGDHPGIIQRKIPDSEKHVESLGFFLQPSQDSRIIISSRDL